MGSYTTACCRRPLCWSAIETAKVGKPWRKLVVPSSGSMIQTNSSSPVRPLSSARKACCGWLRRMVAMMSASALRSMSVTKSLRPLLSIFKESRRERLRTIKSPARRGAPMPIFSRGCMMWALEYQSMTALVRIVLIDPSHPGNIGSVARAMKNMTLSDLVLVRPRAFPHTDAIALAAGADDILSNARIVETVAEAISDASFIAGTTSRPRSYYWEFTTPRDVAGRIVGLAGENRAALLFGSERYGLATEDLNHCNVLVRIPANPEYCSLNLAMSVQLLAYEIFLS